MAIEINEMKLPITPETARSILQRQTDQFGVFFDLDRVLEYEANYCYDMNKLYKRFHSLAGDPRLVVTKGNDIRNILLKRFGIQQYKMLNEYGKPSTDASVRARLMEDEELSEDAREFVKLYHQISKLRYYVSYLQQYKNLPLSNSLAYDGHRMVIGHPMWELLATSRISAKEPSVQNIARDLPDLITQPKGWQLVRADSGQIEPRINFSHFLRDELIVNLITAYDDAYFGMLHFVTMSAEEERLLRQDFNKYFKKHDITDEIKDKRQTIKTLTNAGSYGSSNLGRVDKELADAFDKKIVHHPARLNLEATVRSEVLSGVETFHGAFGTPVTPEETAKYKRNEKGWTEHLIRCGINNPVQTTASELMIFSVFNADRLMSQSKDSHICYYKHDEGAFYISEDEPDLIDKVKGLTAYNVKGWIPIGSDVLIGVKKNKDSVSIL